MTEEQTMILPVC